MKQKEIQSRILFTFNTKNDILFIKITQFNIKTSQI